MRKGLTLIELIISLVIISIVILSIVTFDFAGRQIVVSTDNKSKLLNEASFVIEHIQKNILKTKGYVGHEPIVLTFSSGTDISTISLYSFDITGVRTTIGVYTLSTNTLTYDPGGTGTAVETLTTRCLNLQGQADGAANTSGCGLYISQLVLRLTPASAVHPRDNPEVTIASPSGVIYSPNCSTN